MIYCVYEFSGKDRVIVCADTDEAKSLLNQVKDADQGAKALGYMDDERQIYLYGSKPQSYLTSRVKKAAEAYIQELSYGRG